LLALAGGLALPETYRISLHGEEDATLAFHPEAAQAPAA